MSALKFPGEHVSYEVWETVNGEINGSLPRMTTYYKPNAEEMAEHWQKEADEKATRELWEVKFIVVEATVTRKAVS